MADLAVEQRKALQPVATFVTAAFRLGVLVAVVRVITALTGVGPRFGWGGGNTFGGVCMDLNVDLLEHGSTVVSRAGLAGGVQGRYLAAQVCGQHATVPESIVAAFTALPTAVLYLGAFYLAQRLTRIAVRDGIYTGGIARLVRLLGWWLLAGELAATLVQGLAQLGLLSWLVTWRLDWSQWLVAWLSDINWPVVVIGLALITVARVMLLGVVMREDLDGTV